jgi:hypothetical protein
MDVDPSQTLIAQFTQFAIEKGVTHDEWLLATTERGVKDEADKIDRFFRSWRWRDEDRRSHTMTFLLRVHGEDEQLALSIMKRICDLAGGIDETDLQEYPALKALQGDWEDVELGPPTLTTTEELFLDIEHTPNSFYSDLIDNINSCYQIGVYDATFVLTRKLLENQILDLLRKECETSEIEVYYIPDWGRFRGFRALLEEFEDRLDVYEAYSGGVDDELVRKIKRFKSPADAQAHTIEISMDKDQVDDLGNDAEYAAKVLFRTLQNMD